MEWEAQTGICLSPNFKDSCKCTTLDILGSREMTGQIDWQAKQPSQVACISGDLKCWGTWDTTYRHKAKKSHNRSSRREKHRQRKCSMTFLERWERATVNWNSFKGNAEETSSERWLYRLFQVGRCCSELNWNVALEINQTYQDRQSLKALTFIVAEKSPM